MTATFQSSIYSSSNDNSQYRIRRSGRRLYQVDIENFDHEIESIEVEAHNYAEATEEAQAMYCGDIYNMNIYEIR